MSTSPPPCPTLPPPTHLTSECSACSAARLAGSAPRPPLLQRLQVQQRRLQQQLGAVQAAEEAAPGGGGEVQDLLCIPQRLCTRPTLHLRDHALRAASGGTGVGGNNAARMWQACGKHVARAMCEGSRSTRCVTATDAVCCTGSTSPCTDLWR